MGAMLVRHEATSASAVRRELTRDLQLHGLDDDTIDAATLVASELVGNAIRHTGVLENGALDIGWTVGPDEVVIYVEDPSHELPVRRHADPHCPNGRGLTIVEALASAWGVDPTPQGKRVWAKVTTQQ
jgi:anti-sigma regulatory factor (Ser/Thr protein kinase)